jgi:Lon protease-like protein
MSAVASDFPLFPLGMVALPHELVPLHIFEERYRTMIARCLDEEAEFGIVWSDEEGSRPVGCAMEISDVLERMDDGRLNILCRGTRPFRLVAQQDDLPYPAGTVEFLDDVPEEPDAESERTAKDAYADLLREATDRELEPEVRAALTAYEMAATVEMGPELKQGLLDLRSENARLRLVSRLFRAALRRLDHVDQALVRARSNGRVHFG